jgi:hypothetical protein
VSELEYEKLRITLWREPSGRTFLGDQHGREIDGVLEFTTRRGQQCDETTLRLNHCDVRELEVVNKIARSYSPPMRVRTADGTVTEITDLRPGFQRVVKLRITNDWSPDMMEAFTRSMKRELGEGTVVVCLPPEADLEIIELTNGEHASNANLKRPEADWAF